MEEKESELEVTRDELLLSSRNHSLLEEAVSMHVTPVGFHYTLHHFDVPPLPTSFSLRIGGDVDNSLEFTLDDLKAFPKVTHMVTTECAGNGRTRMRAPRAKSVPWINHAVGTAYWSGVQLSLLLKQAGIHSNVKEIVFTGSDRGIQGGIEHHYQRSLSLENALQDQVILAYEMNNQPLPLQHGAPLRLVVPGSYGMAWVKWLCRIDAISTSFQGYQQSKTYLIKKEKTEVGIPVLWMSIRSLMVPPGLPDFNTRTRRCYEGLYNLRGKVWVGFNSKDPIYVLTVEISLDGGQTYIGKAKIGREKKEKLEPYAWIDWTFPWQATEGKYQLTSRATDTKGQKQPLLSDQFWNLFGMKNNTVQIIDVIVLKSNHEIQTNWSPGVVVAKL